MKHGQKVRLTVDKYADIHGVFKGDVGVVKSLSESFAGVDFGKGEGVIVDRTHLIEVVSDQGLYWRQKYDKLRMFLADIQAEIHHAGFDAPVTNRAWDAPDKLYVSFALEVLCDEDKAIELWGAGMYDEYTLTKPGLNSKEVRS